MATTTDSVTASGIGSLWLRGVASGLVGAAVMTGVMLAMGATSVLTGAIPGLYGLAPPPNPATGLVVHPSHGAALGVGSAAAVDATGATSPRRVVGIGLACGVVAWIVLAGLVMPVWLGTVGFPAVPPLSNFAPPSLLWHAVCATVAGAVYASNG